MRVFVAIAASAIVVAACGGTAAAPSPTPTTAPTVALTVAPTVAPTATPAPSNVFKAQVRFPKCSDRFSTCFTSLLRCSSW